VEDCGSRNGTHLNGRRITLPTGLQASDRLLIGSYVVVFQGDDEYPLETVDVQAADLSRSRAETGLSIREIEVLRLICAGGSDQQVATGLFISIKTVHSHLDRIRAKTGCRRCVELVRFAIDHGIA
jgi:DNA-binding CsgD family transcriptional regulator